MRPIEVFSNSISLDHFIGVIRLRKADLKIIMANVTACDLLGEDNITEKSFSQYIFNKEKLVDFLALIDQDAANDHELQLIRTDGTLRWISISHSLYREKDFTEIVFYDKTADKEKIDALEKKHALLDQFVSHVSHDLRTPIGSLQGLIDLSLREKESVPVLHEYIGMMYNRVRHFDTILNDLTAIAINEKTEIENHVVKIEEEISAILTNHPISKQVHVIIDVRQHDPFITDVRRLRVILRNLISNSIKYQKPSSHYPYIRITIVVRNDQAHIEIADNGIGIPQQHQEKIYAMFYRATEKSTGSGLGLYLVKMMVDKLEGSISHTSSESGSVFKVVIPINASPNSPSVDDCITLFATTWLKPA